MIANKSCIVRLSHYKNALYRLRSLGFVKVVSDNLADTVGVLPSQVRKDFSMFGISGNRRGGYQVDVLIDKISAILGKERTHEVIIVGMGNIGTALMKYRGFEKEGIKISACFDIDSGKHNKDSAIPVLPFEDMKDFVRSRGIKIGVIAVPDIAAQSVIEMMIGCGIQGVLNFAPIRLRAPDNIVVNNVNLELELENVIYFVNAQDNTKAS